MLEVLLWTSLAFFLGIGSTIGVLKASSYGSSAEDGDSDNPSPDLLEKFSLLKEDFRDLQHHCSEALHDVEKEYEKIRAVEIRMDKKLQELRELEEGVEAAAQGEGRELVEEQITRNLEGGPNGGEGGGGQVQDPAVAAFLARRQ